MVTWAEGESIEARWTQICLEKLELAAETVRLIFFILGDDAALGPLSYLYVLIRRARVQIISNGECTGEDITVQSLGHLGLARPWAALREYQENAHLRSSIASTRDTIQELQTMVSDEDPVHAFFGPPLDLRWPRGRSPNFPKGLFDNQPKQAPAPHKSCPGLSNV